MVHTFRYKDFWLALDEYSGAVHVLDDNARLAVERLASGAAPDAVAAELAPAMGAADAAELLAEIESLRADGQLFAPAPELEIKHTPGEIKAMCLHAAHDCDLRCSYCFAATGSFHGGRSLMSPAIGRAALDFEGPYGMLAGSDALVDDRAFETIATAFMISIGGGTDQIQRNIVGERVLGLPAEPRADKDLSFRQLPVDGAR